MAETSYPKVGAGPWYTLRSKAVNSPTASFTAQNVATWLDQKVMSARNNVLLPMTKLGIIDDKGQLTPLGKKWRNDGTYAEACDEIIAKNYPADLASMTGPDGRPEYKQVLTWLQHHGLGKSNAEQVARTYVLIAGKEPNPATQPKPSKSSGGQSAPKKAAPKPAKTSTPQVRQETPPPPLPPPAAEKGRPDLHIDIQVHIGADASPEQIDAVFASMAKHIYKK